MTVINVIETVKEFLKQEVCPEIKLLVPDRRDGKDYVEEYANPEVFAFFEPERGRLPEGVEYTTPSIIVLFTQGEDDLVESKQRLNIVLAFNTWRPGDYSTVNEVELGSIDEEAEGITIKYKGKIEKEFFRNEDGWKDVYNLMELTKGKLISAGKIGNFPLAPTPIKYGPYTKDSALIDFYPYYHLWMSFTLTSIPTPMTRDDIDELL